MTEIFAPPMLARGSFNPKSGVGCIMNLMCWVKHYPADQVTDEPENFYDTFQEILVMLNDTMCAHLRAGKTNPVATLYGEPVSYPEWVELNCPDCSELLLDWAFALDRSGFLGSVCDIYELGGTEVCEDHGENLSQCKRDQLNPKERARFDKLTAKANHEADQLDFVIRFARCFDPKAYRAQFEYVEEPPFGDLEQIKEAQLHGQHRKNYRAQMAKVIRAMNSLCRYYKQLEAKYNPLPPLRLEMQELVPEAVRQYGITTVPTTK